MRAVVFDHVGELPQVREVPRPSCPPEGALIQVSASGVCRSDWHAWRGHDPVLLPHIPGHEFAGRVAEVGVRVRKWHGGERVTTPFVCGCGRCEYCRAGDAQVCPDQTQPGFTGPGSFADFVMVDHADFNLVALPEQIDDVAAAALGCRFATAYRGIVGHHRVGPGQWVAVFGAGGVGLSAVMIAVALGARVLAIDISDAALRWAAAAGAEPMRMRPGIWEDIAERTAGGVHLGMDALGHPDLADASVRSLRRRGCHVQAGLLLGGQASPGLPMDLVVARELAIHGTHGLAAAEYPRLLDLVMGSEIPLADLIADRISLDQAPQALADMDAPVGAAGINVIVW